MTGETGPLVDGFVQKPWGVNYGLWTHPLTPYRRQKEGSEPYSVKPKSARFGYRDWTPVVVGETHGVLAIAGPKRRASRESERAKTLRGADGADASMRAAGWAMNNMEAVAYLSAEQPLHLAASEEAQIALDLAAKRFARFRRGRGGDARAGAEGGFVFGRRQAGDRQSRVRGGPRRLLRSLRRPFHDLLNAILEAPEAEGESTLAQMAARPQPSGLFRFRRRRADPARRPRTRGSHRRAFRNLRAGLSGFGKAGQALFQILELPPPGGERGQERKAQWQVTRNPWSSPC